MVCAVAHLTKHAIKSVRLWWLSDSVEETAGTTRVMTVNHFGIGTRSVPTCASTGYPLIKRGRNAELISLQIFYERVVNTTLWYLSVMVTRISIASLERPTCRSDR